jgi:diguanylate cyclase (GGDEF)-like protein
MGFYSDFSRKYNKALDEGKNISLFISDIDKFKRVNDTYGHNAGDDVLSTVASIMDSSCGENEAVYRWGGEEFVMMIIGAIALTVVVGAATAILPIMVDILITVILIKLIIKLFSKKKDDK